MCQGGLHVCMDLRVVGTRVSSQDRLRNELAGGKILPYGDAARPAITEVEARRKNHTCLDPLPHRLGQQRLLITEVP